MMEKVLAWLNSAVSEGAALLWWQALAIGVAAFVLICIAVIIIVRAAGKKKARAAAADAVPSVPAPEKAPDNGATCMPDSPPLPVKPVLEICNLQGVGDREEQQDAFSISRLDRADADGLLAVLCDGMGGMADGRVIAQRVVSQVMEAFPFGRTEAFGRPLSAALSRISSGVYADHRGQGGATLVMTYILGDRLWFWCVGDSDLFLLRADRLYPVNRRHEYINDLYGLVLDEKLAIDDALANPQKGALSEYMGADKIETDRNLRPFALRPGDALLLCSDGVSDTLSLTQIEQSMRLSAAGCCDDLERRILAAARPGQDNYTAIVISYGR